MSNRSGRRLPDVDAYLKPKARIAIYSMSPYSIFEDQVWRFDALVPGQRTVSINWRLGVPVEIWLRKEFQTLLRDVKRILLAYLLEDKPKPSTFIAHATGFRNLIRWMFSRYYMSISSLDDQARKEYFRFVCGQYLDEKNKLNVVGETIDRSMFVMTLLLRHRDRFDSLPRIQVELGSLRGFTWGGSGRGIGADEPRPIPPVPEEVFNPLMLEALRWVDDYSPDIIELARIQEAAAENCYHWKSKNYAYYICRELTGFQFRKCLPHIDPWRPAIQECEETEIHDEEGTHVRKLRPLAVIRRLINDLIASCSIVIQGFTGMRVSEVLGLTISDEESEWPSCIECSASVDELNDVFYVVGRSFKGEDDEDGKEGKWVVGIRPAGSQFVPEVVRAIQVVIRLLASWRKLRELDSLFVYPTGGVGGGIPRQAGSIGQLQSDRLRLLQNSFLDRHVKVPVKWQGWQLTTHQFRKKFAQDIVRCDPNAMPAVREHFKQLSMHVLDSNYLGNDAELLATVDDFALREATAQIMAILDDEPMAGKLPALVSRQSHRLLKAIPRSMDPVERFEALSKIVDREGVRAWPCDFGTCLFRPEIAQCHFAGKGYYDASAERPLASERCADRCCNCSNLVISARHVEYWTDRYMRNRSLARQYKNDGTMSWAILASRRAKIASSVLKAHNISVKDLDDAA